MSSGFHEVRFPDRIAVGAVGGPAFSTTVIATASGYEQRNINWAEARGRWNVATGIKRREDVAELIEFFRCRMGRAYGFRFKVHTDFRALAQLLGTGDGSTTTLQLVKRYTSRSGDRHPHHPQACERHGHGLPRRGAGNDRPHGPAQRYRRRRGRAADQGGLRQLRLGRALFVGDTGFYARANLAEVGRGAGHYILRRRSGA
jgi:hypothetical protein